MSLLAFLVSLDAQILDQLYQSQWTCQAIFRSLPPLAKQYVMRLIYMDDTIKEEKLKKWLIVADEQTKKAHDEAIGKLIDLKICSFEQRSRSFRLNQIFIKEMRAGISNLRSAVVFPETNLGKDKNPPTLHDLDVFSRRSWEIILHMMLGISVAPCSNSLVDLIIRAGLMDTSLEEESLTINASGYRFLLKDAHTQVWTLLQTHLANHLHLPTLLTFLFQLSFLTVGKSIPIDHLTDDDPLKSFIDLLHEMGLIYKVHAKSRRCYPTKAAINLATGQDPVRQEGYIIVETNGRVFCYCSSCLTITLLSTFLDMTSFRAYRLPNMVVGIISRDSVQTALKKGITADLIIEFLELNAHEQARKEPHPIPETLADQIRLWEKETNVVQYQPAVRYDNFPSTRVYEDTKQFALRNDILLFCQDSKSIIVKGGCESVMEEFFSGHG